jgi:uncharacterized membrane protein YqjE
MNTPAPSPAASPRPQMPPLRVAVELFSESAAHRAELAVLELEEAREHVAGSSLLAGLVAALTLFAGFAFTLLVASLVWELPSRGWWLGGLCSLYVVAAVTAGLMLARRLRDWRPLGETQTQLQQDYQCLSQLIKSNAP